MGLFSFLSGKKDKAEQPKESNPERRTIDTPLGRFYYVSSPDCTPPEIGYEGRIDWPGSRDEEKMGVYIDCDTPESGEASVCLERLERLASDKEGTEYRAKSAAADHFLKDKPRLIRNDTGGAVTREELIKDMELTFISIYRNGDTVCSVDHRCWLDIRSDDVLVTFKADGSREFGYNEYD